MKLFYCGFNGFKQLEESNTTEADNVSPFKVSSDICQPTLVFDSESNTLIDVYLGWSRLIITTIDGSIARGYWNGMTGFDGSISKAKSWIQITCTEQLAVGIDKNMKLKKLTLANGPAQTDWEDVMTNRKDFDVDEHKRVEGSRFTKVASNDHSVVALDESGVIHLPPLVIENIQARFVDVACGKEHFIALTRDGTVYTWGSGSRGQLGHGTVESIEQPEEIEVLGGIKIVQIAAGGWHSCALSDSGDVYVWGWNESGQLGLPCRNMSGSSCKSNEYVSIQSEPRLLDGAMPFSAGDVNVTSIGCGARHTAVTLGDKSGWSWGWNGCGQLGTGDRRSHDTPVCVIQDVEKVMCGAWSTAWLSNL